MAILCEANQTPLHLGSERPGERGASGVDFLFQKVSRLNFA